MDFIYDELLASSDIKIFSNKLLQIDQILSK